MSSYSEKFKDPRWQKKRLQIMNRDKFTCKLCGDKKTTLNVHHKEYINGNDPWDYLNNMLVTLCEDCHKAISIVHFKDVPFNEFRVLKKISDDESIVIFISAKSKGSRIILSVDGSFVVNLGIAKSAILDVINILKKGL